MKTVTLAGVFLLGTALGASGGQSLAEIAKKEKERRQSNTEPVTVVDQRMGGSEAEDVETAGPPEDATDAATGDEDPSVDPAAERAEVAARESEFRAERADCAQRLKIAHDELNRQNALLQKGVIRWAKAPTTYGGTINNGNNADGSEEFIGSPGYYRYEQGRIACVTATGNRSKYPDEAAECDAIQERIDELRAEIGAGCK